MQAKLTLFPLSSVVKENAHFVVFAGLWQVFEGWNGGQNLWQELGYGVGGHSIVVVFWTIAEHFPELRRQSGHSIVVVFWGKGWWVNDCGSSKG